VAPFFCQHSYRTGYIMTIISSDDSVLSKLSAALRPLEDLANQTLVAMPVSLVQTFLLVAARPDRTVTELADAAGVRNGTMSRRLADLSAVNRCGAPGMGLVERNVNGVDRRHVRNRLSVKGNAVIRQIINAMHGTVKVAA
jgi:DNA-binding MarR family transcriptional regulator